METRWQWQSELTALCYARLQSQPLAPTTAWPGTVRFTWSTSNEHNMSSCFVNSLQLYNVWAFCFVVASFVLFSCLVCLFEAWSIIYKRMHFCRTVFSISNNCSINVIGVIKLRSTAAPVAGRIILLRLQVHCESVWLSNTVECRSAINLQLTSLSLLTFHMGISYTAERSHDCTQALAYTIAVCCAWQV